MFDTRSIDLTLSTMMLFGQNKEYIEFKSKMDRITGDPSRNYLQEFLNFKTNKMFKEAIEAVDKKSNEAMEAFLEHNCLTSADFSYVSDSGFIPIYTFKGSQVNFDLMVPPEGYILQRTTLKNGSFTYQLLQKNEISKFNCSNYEVVVHFIEEKEWELT